MIDQSAAAASSSMPILNVKTWLGITTMMQTTDNMKE
jgi:hypothetical protein